MNKLNNNIKVPITAAVGTIISGTVFLGTALLVIGSLPVAFPVLFITIVLPAAAINTFTTYICYNVVFSARNAVRRA